MTEIRQDAPTQTPQAAAKKEKDQRRQSLKYQRDKDREIVRGIFRFYEVPGGTLSFSFRAYKEDPVENYSFVDGQIYSIPLGVAKHLNKNLWYPVHAFAQDENGKPNVKVGKKVRRAGFDSLEFHDQEDLSQVGDTGLVSVEYGKI